MKKINDSENAPLRFVLDGRTLGQYYNSIDKTYHLCDYVPFVGGPKVYCCGKVGNYSPSRRESIGRNKCAKCFSLLTKV